MEQNNQVDKKIELSVIMPALNEEKTISAAISSTLESFKDLGINGEIVAINDGSIDDTKNIIEQMIKKDNRVRLINHNLPQGIGASFWDGVDNALGQAVVMLPGDNENNLSEILRYKHLLDEVDIIVPFSFNKNERSALRNLLSSIYLFIINNTFGFSFNYTNGTIVYKRSLLNELDCRQTGFFYQTDILIRLVKRGYLYAEVPYRLKARKGGSSKAVSLKSLMNVMRGYINLFCDIYFENKNKRVSLRDDSASFKRYMKK